MSGGYSLSMPHGMQLNTMATQITQLQVAGLLPKATSAFLTGLTEYWCRDVLLFHEEFGTRRPEDVLRDTKFYLSTKGFLRALLPNDIVNIWNPSEESWDDNDHDE